MSGDEKSGGPVRRRRAIGRPYVPPGRLADLKALIYELYLVADTPTLDEMAVWVADDDGLAGAPSRDTIGRIIGDPGMPASQADIVAVVTVLAREARWDVDDAVIRARDLWVAARMNSVRAPAGGTRVSQADPRRLGVHAAISVPGVTDEIPPEYVLRDADDGEFGLRGKVAAAAERGGFVLLVGGSSVGKTRCAFEAVTALLPDWWLVHPAGPGEIVQLATAPTSRTVVWLDELQRYLDGERGLTVAIMRALMDPPHPALVIGTLWPDWYEFYATLPSPGGNDRHAEARGILDLATKFHIAPAFSRAEQDRANAAAARDPRLKIALGAAGYGLTQTLAAAPQLVARWQNAKTANPYAWAVLTAALDAARLGAHAPLSAHLLRAAARGYCTGQQQAEAPENWFEQALAYATGKLHGAAAALTPAGAGMGQVAGYTAADYLIQHANRERRYARVPASTWDAVLTNIRDPAALGRLADSARNRLLYRYAIPLYRHAADANHWGAAERLAELLARHGDLDGLRGRADAGDRRAATLLAALLAEHGDLDGLRAWAEAGHVYAARRLAELLARHGDLEGLRGRADAGDRDAATLLAEHGDLDGLRGMADAGDRGAAELLARLLAERGDLNGAAEIAQILHARADADDRDAATLLAELLARRGDLEGLRGMADAGYVGAVLRLDNLLAKRGDVDGLRARADAGDRDAATLLAELLAERGDLDGLHALADAGHGYAARRLAELQAERGDLDGLHALADAGDWAAAEWLAELLAEHGDADGLRGLAEVGHGGAARRLAALLAGRGDLEGLRGMADAGYGGAAERLAALLAGRGDFDGLRAWADANDRGAAELLAEHGDVDGLRARVDAGDGAAAELLAELLFKHGRDEEAERLHRFGLNLDGSIASV